MKQNFTSFTDTVYRIFDDSHSKITIIPAILIEKHVKFFEISLETKF